MPWVDEKSVKYSKVVSKEIKKNNKKEHVK